MHLFKNIIFNIYAFLILKSVFKIKLNFIISDDDETEDSDEDESSDETPLDSSIIYKSTIPSS